jgi:hypothetical protein
MNRVLADYDASENALNRRYATGRHGRRAHPALKDRATLNDVATRPAPVADATSARWKRALPGPKALRDAP